MSTAKILTSNMLSRTKIWKLDPVGLTLPPSIAITGTVKNYQNLVATSALFSDGDQNLPFFMNAVSMAIEITFNVAVIPKAIAMINHNCFTGGANIKIYAGPNKAGKVLLETIQNPNRSVDKFYPLRFNDAWVNVNDVSQPYWEVQLNGALNVYLGELFFASEYFELQDFAPQPDYNIAMNFSRRKASHEFYSGESADYDIKSPVVSFNLDWSRKDVKTGTNYDLFYDWVPKHLDALGQSPSRQVFIWRDDRVCMFGRIEEAAGLGWFPDKSYSPRYAFVGEYPRRFYRDAVGI